jgi:hypothetical protein
MVNANGSKSVLVKTAGHEELLSGLADERALPTFIILKRNSILNETSSHNYISM